VTVTNWSLDVTTFEDPAVANSRWDSESLSEGEWLVYIPARELVGVGR
jgi:hypothetical protein